MKSQVTQTPYHSISQDSVRVNWGLFTLALLSVTHTSYSFVPWTHLRSQFYDET